MAKTNYGWEARTIDGFLAQLIRYVASGHYFYVTDRIPVARERRTRVFPPRRPQAARPVRSRQWLASAERESSPASTASCSP